MNRFYQLPDNLRDDIAIYENEVNRFLSGELSYSLFRARRVPRGIYEQRKNGTYMVRVRIAGGVLDHIQIEALARLAMSFGNSVLHITTRQDIQLHDIHIEDTPEIMRRLISVNLTSLGGGGNTVRNVTSCWLSGICPAEVFDVTPFALGVTEYLIAKKGSYNLPRKFKIAFSGCSTDCAYSRANDIGFVACVQNRQLGFRMYAGGGMGAYSRIADLIENYIRAQDIIRAAEAWRLFFDRYGNRKNKHRARLRFVFDGMGVDTCIKEYKRIFSEICDSVKESPSVSDISHCDIDKPHSNGWSFEWINNVRCIKQKQDGFVAIPIFIPYGLLSAKDALLIADIARRFRVGLRTSPDQNITLCNIPYSDIGQIVVELGKLSYDAFSWTFSNHFIVCAGASTCRLGLCSSRNAVKECETAIQKRNIQQLGMNALRICVNGCSNACGQSPCGHIGLAGVALRADGRLVPAYRILVGGRSGEHNIRFSTDFVGTVPAKMIGEAVAVLVSDFAQNRKEQESFDNYYDKKGLNYLIKLIEPFTKIPLYTENPDFYRDIGQTEEFTLAGRGAGECGAGVFEVIEEDISTARKQLEKLSSSSDRNQLLLDAMIVIARALLITRGIDTHKSDEILRAFENHFVDTGLVPDSYRELLTRTRGKLHGWHDALTGKESDIRSLLECVEQLFNSLDSNLEFHPPWKESPNTLEVTKKDVAIEMLDLSGVACPMNFVKAKLKLETMQVGASLVLLLDDGEPIRNVPASFENEGQKVEEIKPVENGRWKVVIKKIK